MRDDERSMRYGQTDEAWRINMDETLKQLEALLVRQLETHQRLGRLCADKIVALRQADYKAVARLLDQENRAVQAIGAGEKERLLVMAELTQQL